MDNRDALKSMLNNLINDKPEEASLDLHNYLTVKMKDVAGIGSSESAVTDDDTSSEDDSTSTETETE